MVVVAVKRGWNNVWYLQELWFDPIDTPPPPLGSGHRVPHNQFLKFLSKNLMSVRLFSLLWGTYVKMQGSFT